MSNRQEANEEVGEKGNKDIETENETANTCDDSIRRKVQLLNAALDEVFDIGNGAVDCVRRFTCLTDRQGDALKSLFNNCVAKLRHAWFELQAEKQGLQAIDCSNWKDLKRMLDLLSDNSITSRHGLSIFLADSEAARELLRNIEELLEVDKPRVLRKIKELQSAEFVTEQLCDLLGCNIAELQPKVQKLLTSCSNVVKMSDATDIASGHAHNESVARLNHSLIDFDNTLQYGNAFDGQLLQLHATSTPQRNQLPPVRTQSTPQWELSDVLGRSVIEQPRNERTESPNISERLLETMAHQMMASNLPKLLAFSNQSDERFDEFVRDLKLRFSPLYTEEQKTTLFARNLKGTARAMYDALPNSIKNGSFDGLVKEFQKRLDGPGTLKRLQYKQTLSTFTAPERMSVEQICNEIETIAYKAYPEESDKLQREKQLCSALLKSLQNCPELSSYIDASFGKTNKALSDYAGMKEVALRHDAFKQFLSVSAEEKKPSEKQQHQYVKKNKNNLMRSNAYKGDASKVDESVEKSLNPNASALISITCFRCGKPGHKAVACKTSQRVEALERSNNFGTSSMWLPLELQRTPHEEKSSQKSSRGYTVAAITVEPHSDQIRDDQNGRIAEPCNIGFLNKTRKTVELWSRTTSRSKLAREKRSKEAAEPCSDPVAKGSKRSRCGAVQYRVLQEKSGNGRSRAVLSQWAITVGASGQKVSAGSQRTDDDAYWVVNNDDGKLKCGLTGHSMPSYFTSVLTTAGDVHEEDPSRGGRKLRSWRRATVCRVSDAFHHGTLRKLSGSCRMAKWLPRGIRLIRKGVLRGLVGRSRTTRKRIVVASKRCCFECGVALARMKRIDRDGIAAEYFRSKQHELKNVNLGFDLEHYVVSVKPNRMLENGYLSVGPNGLTVAMEGSIAVSRVLVNPASKYLLWKKWTDDETVRDHFNIAARFKMEVMSLNICSFGATVQDPCRLYEKKQPFDTIPLHLIRTSCTSLSDERSEVLWHDVDKVTEVHFSVFKQLEEAGSNFSLPISRQLIYYSVSSKKTAGHSNSALHLARVDSAKLSLFAEEWFWHTLGESEEAFVEQKLVITMLPNICRAYWIEESNLRLNKFGGKHRQVLHEKIVQVSMDEAGDQMELNLDDFEDNRKKLF